MVEVRQARYFIAVAEELHFGRAAARLSMSQPPLSQAIRALERQIDVRLLERTTRSVALTSAGHVFLERCRRLVDESVQAQAAAQEAADGFRGRLRLGAVTSAFLDPLPWVLAAFSADRPDVLITATEVDTHTGVQALLDGTLDVAVVRQSSAPPGLRTIPLRRDRLVAALPSSWGRGRAEDTLALGDLATDSWVWIPRHISPGYHDEIAAACRAAGFSPVAQHVARSIDSQLAMVGCGLGVALVPERSRSTAPPTVQFRDLTANVELDDLSLVHHNNAGASVRVFAQLASGGPVRA